MQKQVLNLICVLFLAASRQPEKMTYFAVSALPDMAYEPERAHDAGRRALFQAPGAEKPAGDTPGGSGIVRTIL